MAKLPKAFETFRRRYRSVYDAYDALGGAVHGIAIGGRLEGAVRSHAQRVRGR